MSETEILREAIRLGIALVGALFVVIWFFARRQISASDEVRREVTEKFATVFAKLDSFRDHVDDEFREIWIEIRGLDGRVRTNEANDASFHRRVEAIEAEAARRRVAGE